LLDNDDKTLFKKRERNDSILSIRMNKRQKDWICREVERLGVTKSRYILDLIDGDYQRLQSRLDNAGNDLK
jgi:hypothetical protein